MTDERRESLAEIKKNLESSRSLLMMELMDEESGDLPEDLFTEDEEEYDDDEYSEAAMSLQDAIGCLDQAIESINAAMK